MIKIIASALSGAFLAHFFSQRRENKIKSYEARKKEYIKLAELTVDLIKVATSGDMNKLKKVLDQFNWLGLKLAIVGSKELLESYLFFRYISQNVSTLMH